MKNYLQFFVRKVKQQVQTLWILKIVIIIIWNISILEN